MTNPSSSAPYTVFISHAGEDKATMAIPLRKKLRAKGITAFVDEADMPSGTDAIQDMKLAMNTARIGVMILSPEFIVKKWPMLELMHFLERRKECCGKGNEGRESPTIIPCFYRLSVADLYQPKLDPVLCRKTRFYERQRLGEPEANMEKIKASLATLRRIMGVRNDVEANNESSYIMNKKRELLLSELCREIEKCVTRKQTSASRAGGRNTRTYEIQEGDILWDIALREYGDPLRWKDILEANRNVIRDETKIYPGMKIKLPD